MIYLEIEPSVGVFIVSIENLADLLARLMAAHELRVLLQYLRFAVQLQLHLVRLHLRNVHPQCERIDRISMLALPPSSRSILFTSICAPGMVATHRSSLIWNL
jgi:DNA segregation ATPase FtsK/SpoIIIE-like protein